MSNAEKSPNKIIELKNKYINKKALFFSCGKNITEFKNNLNDFKNNDDYVYISYKNSITYLQNNCHIFIYDSYYKENVNNEIKSDIKIFYNSKNNDTDINKYSIKPDIHFKYNDSHPFGFISNEHSNLINEIGNETVVYTSWIDVYFQIFFLLNYLGFKEIYLFGIYNCHNDKKIFKKLVSNGNKLGNNNLVVKEPLSFIRVIQTEYLAKWALLNSVKLYNVSLMGSVSNEIPRIHFNQINAINKKLIDIKIENIDDLLDYSFYQQKYKCCKHQENDSDILKKQVIVHYFTIGIYRRFDPNPYTNYEEIQLGKISVDLCKLAFFACLFPLDKFSDNKNTLQTIYLVHVYHLLFYKGYDVKKIIHMTKFKLSDNDSLNYFDKFIKKKHYWLNIQTEHKKFINSYFNEFVTLYKLIHE